jgi:hypothetical protein
MRLRVDHRHKWVFSLTVMPGEDVKIEWGMGDEE